MSEGYIFFHAEPQKNDSKHSDNCLSIKSGQIDCCKLFLLSNLINYPIFKFIPRQFIISTKSESCHFNIELLKNASPVINNFIIENPNNFHYFLNINDENNVLSKFEKLFQGMNVKFTVNDIPASKQITKLLQIKNCPNYLKLDSLYSYNCDSDLDLSRGVIIDKYYFEKFLQNEDLQTFIIKTNKKEYKCNLFGVYSSNVICEMLDKKSHIKQYYYNFEDENEEFQSICDLFNFKHVFLTVKNMNSVKTIAEELQINIIMTQINNFIAKYEERTKKIEEQRVYIDPIDTLFYWLYNIDKISVEFVYKSIVESDWISSKENIQELAAFILQVIQTDYLIHQKIADLLIKLTEGSNNSNCLNFLMPFIIEKLLSLLNDNLILQFTYILFKKGFLTKEKFKDMIDETNFSLTDFKFCYKHEFIDFYESFLSKYCDLYSGYYNEMLKKYYIDDKIIDLIKNDDLDTIQILITKDEINALNDNLIKYSAQFGSIKCFNYFLMNNGKVDKYSLFSAVDGGNMEIIKLTYQKLDDKDIKDILTYSNYSNENLLLMPIRKHQNEIYDWIYDQSIDKKVLYDYNINDIQLRSALYGNAYPIIQIIKNGLKHSCDEYEEIIENAAKNGFYKLMQLLLNLNPNKSKKFKCLSNKINYKSFISFGNIAIFELFIQNTDKNNIKSVFMSAISKNQIEVINYIFDNFVNKTFHLKKQFVVEILKTSLTEDDGICFNLIINKLKTWYPDVFEIVISYNLLYESCQNKHFSSTQIITDYILSKNPKYDFTDEFTEAATLGANDICQFFIEKKVFIDYENFIYTKNKELLISYDVFITIYNNISSNAKKKCLKFLNKAIRGKNKKIVEFLLEKKATSKNTLINAVSTGDIEIVDLVLKYNSEPSFINQMESGNTPILLAVKNNNFEIAIRLLSIPGINLNLVDKSNKYPLIYAIEASNLEIIDAFIDFYGDELQSNPWMVSDVLSALMKTITMEKNLKSIFIMMCDITYRKWKPWDIVKHIYDIKSFDPNFSNDYTFLHLACNDNNFEMVEYFLKLDGIDVNKYTYKSGQTALIIAAKNGNAEIAELLIKYPKTDINFRDFQKDTALTIAVQNNFINIVDLLIKNERFDPKESRLNQAFKISKGDISKRLISLEYFDINHVFRAKEKEEKFILQNFLTFSVEKNDSDKIDLILNHPSFNKKRSSIIGAIFMAAKKNNTDAFKKLLNLLDNDINISNEKYETITEYAQNHSYKEINSIIEILKNSQIPID